VKTCFLTSVSTRRIERLLAKTKIFGQAQFLDFVQGLLKFFALMKIFWQQQNILTAMSGEFGRQKQKVGTNRVQGGPEIFFRKTEPFEPMHDVGREEKQLKESDVGFPGIAGDFGQGIIVKEFAVVLFDRGSGIVEQINAPGRHRQIGNERMVNVFDVLEQSQLFGFDGVCWNRTTHNDEAMARIPLLMNIFEEFADFPTVVELPEPTSSRSGFDDRIFSGHDDISHSVLVEKLDDFPAVKARIHPESNAASGDVLWGFVQTRFEEGDGPRSRGSVAGAQSPVPEFLPMRFETKQRMITSSAGLLGVVTDPTALLFAVDCNHDRIDIEGQAGSFAGQISQVNTQTVVQSGQLTNRLRTQTFQEPPQSRLVGKPTQSQNLQKKSVVLQDLGFVDPLHAHDDRVQQSHDQFGRMICLVRLRKTNRLLQKFFEAKFLAKTVDQEHPTEVCQVAAPEENFDFAGPFWHNTQTVHFGRFLCGRFYGTYYIVSSSLKSNLKPQNNRISRFFEDNTFYTTDFGVIFFGSTMFSKIKKCQS
jgi:hypothetical protein